MDNIEFQHCQTECLKKKTIARLNNVVTMIYGDSKFYTSYTVFLLLYDISILILYCIQ
jgi:hypothetical protein